MRVSKSSHYEFNNEMFSAITHAFALGLAVTGTIALGIKGVNSGSQVELFSLIGFGVSLMLLYTASTANRHLGIMSWRHCLQTFLSESLQASGNDDLRCPRLALLSRHGSIVASFGPSRFLAASRRWCGLYRRSDALSAKRHPLHPRYLAPLCDSRQPVHVLIDLFLSVK